MSHDPSLAKNFVQFTGDDPLKKALVDTYIDGCPQAKELRLFASEFCAATGAVLTLPQKAFSTDEDLRYTAEWNPVPDGRVLLLVRTPNYMPAGNIYVESKFDRTKGERVLNYCYSAKHIRKDRAKAGEKTTRVSTKIASLLASLRKNNEFPTDQVVAAPLLVDMGYAANYALSARGRQPTVNLPGELQVSLVKWLANHEPIPDHHVVTVNNMYKDYLKEVEALEDKSKVLNRFKQYGYWAIAFPHYATVKWPSYYIAKMEPDESGNVKPVGNALKFSRTLEHIPEVHMALMFAKPFFEKEGGRTDNVYCIPRMDKYYPEPDVGIGYNSGDMTWVFVPVVSE